MSLSEKQPEKVNTYIGKQDGKATINVEAIRGIASEVLKGVPATSRAGIRRAFVERLSASLLLTDSALSAEELQRDKPELWRQYQEERASQELADQGFLLDNTRRSSQPPRQDP